MDIFQDIKPRSDIRQKHRAAAKREIAARNGIPIDDFRFSASPANSEAEQIEHPIEKEFRDFYQSLSAPIPHNKAERIYFDIETEFKKWTEANPEPTASE